MEAVKCLLMDIATTIQQPNVRKVGVNSIMFVVVVAAAMVIVSKLIALVVQQQL